MNHPDFHPSSRVSSSHKPARWLPAAALVVLLTACGGGGGEGADGGDGSGAPPSGLVPAAPTLGEVLEADARVLRPLEDGASWDYHGTLRRVSSDTILETYANKRTQRSTVAGFEETESNAANAGENKASLRLVQGRIELPDTLELPGRPGEPVIGLELRSPVRVGDQYVSLDRRITDLPDIDGDGRSDTLEVAIFARVIGRETLTPPTLPVMQTVRVDQTILIRFRLSADVSLRPVEETVQRLWYARGIGIVRSQLEQRSETYLSRIVADEWLLAHRGRELALGPQPPQPARQEGADILLSPTTLESLFFHWGGETLWLQRRNFEPGRWLALNAQGQVTADRSTPDNDVRAGLRQGESGVSSLSQDGTGPVMQTVAFDRQGVRLGGPVSTDFSERIPLKTVQFVDSVLEGDRLWHSLKTSQRVFSGPTTFVDRLVLRAVDRLTGEFLTPEIDIGESPQAVSKLAVAGGVLRQVRGRIEADGRVTLRLLSLPLSPLGEPQWQDLAAGLEALEVRRLSLQALSDGRMVLLWRGNFNDAEFGPGPLAAVVIGVDGSMQRSPAPTLADEVLGALPTDVDFEGVRGQRLWFSRRESGQMLPGERIRPHDRYFALDVGSRPLASTGVQSIVVSERHLTGVDFAGIAVSKPLILEDRLLWLYRGGPDGGTRLFTQAVHLPPSAPEQ